MCAIDNHKRVSRYDIETARPDDCWEPSKNLGSRNREDFLNTFKSGTCHSGIPLLKLSVQRDRQVIELPLLASVAAAP
jgi:hypothetical protein